ncbi:hypothetical protein [Campylobacter armoricus]|uniref:hypothetical protein n=1 Tax=Campylobacter armoricus TaxID=2505970 RepID=UPI001F2AC868|nr:hypothetical protein [Campylobacter armoricus]
MFILPVVPWVNLPPLGRANVDEKSKEATIFESRICFDNFLQEEIKSKLFDSPPPWRKY